MTIKNYLESTYVPTVTFAALMDAVKDDDGASLELLINTLPMGAHIRNDLNIIWAMTYDKNHD